MNRFLNPLCLSFVVAGAFRVTQAQLKALPNELAIFAAPLQPQTPSKRGVVFTSRLAREFGDQCSRQSPMGYWTTVAPSKNEVKNLENALPMWIKSQHSRGWSSSFSAYYFQYGALVRGKKRLIYVNALPFPKQDKRQVWRRGPEVVCDGGPNFWGVEFDPQTRKFHNASFNGML